MAPYLVTMLMAKLKSHRAITHKKTASIDPEVENMEIKHCLYMLRQRTLDQEQKIKQKSRDARLQNETQKYLDTEIFYENQLLKRREVLQMTEPNWEDYQLNFEMAKSNRKVEEKLQLEIQENEKMEQEGRSQRKLQREFIQAMGRIVQQEENADEEPQARNPRSAHADSAPVIYRFEALSNDTLQLRKAKVLNNLYLKRTNEAIMDCLGFMFFCLLGQEVTPDPNDLSWFKTAQRLILTEANRPSYERYFYLIEMMLERGPPRNEFWSFVLLVLAVIAFVIDFRMEEKRTMMASIVKLEEIARQLRDLSKS